MDNQKSTRLNAACGPREFWLRILIPAVLLIVLLMVLIGSRPGDDMVPAMLIVGVGLLASVAVGLTTGAAGPAWVIYLLISIEVALLLVLPAPWRELALMCVPVSAIGFLMGREIAFLLSSRHPKYSPTTWVVTGEPVADVRAAKQRAISRLRTWDSLRDGRFIVALGHRRFEAWGDHGEGFVVHVANDDRDLSTMHVLNRVPHQDGEVSVTLDGHGLVGWVPRSVKVPTSVAEQALDGFFETQGAKPLAGWDWEGGAHAQELRFL